MAPTQQRVPSGAGCPARRLTVPGTQASMFGSPSIQRPAMRLEPERIAVVETARRMSERALVVNTSGNVSVRAGAWLAITPSAVPYERMSPDDVCLVDIATGEPDRASLMPSTELPLHLAIYRTTGAGAVVHTHSHFATVLSTV